MALEKHLQRLMTTDGFIEAFWEMSSEYPGSQEQAYEAVDQMHSDAFGNRKYANFNSFRVVRDNYLKRKRDANRKKEQKKA
jgi:hypothetical protein